MQSGTNGCILSHIFAEIDQYTVTEKGMKGRRRKRKRKRERERETKLVSYSLPLNQYGTLPDT